MFTTNRKVFSFPCQQIFTFIIQFLIILHTLFLEECSGTVATRFFCSKVFVTTSVIFSNVLTTPHQLQGALFPGDLECYFFATESFYIQFYFESYCSLNLHSSGIYLLRIPI